MHVVCMYVYTCICMCAWVYTYVSVCTCRCSVYLYLFVCVGCVLQYFGSVRWVRTSCRRPGPDLNSCRCGPDTMVIRRPIHEMIRRSVPVRAVKTRWRFGSKTASFHVSVRSCAFSYLPLSVCIYMLHLSFHVTFCDNLLVWLLVSLHEISMIVHFIYIVDRSLHQCYFMYW